jgi:tryptophanase
MDVVAESVVEVWESADQGRGPQMVCEPGDLRCFQARFEPVG